MEIETGLDDQLQETEEQELQSQEEAASEDGDTEKTGEEEQEQVSTPQYVTMERFNALEQERRKMQSTLQQNETEWKNKAQEANERTLKMAELLSASQKSRKSVDPLDERYSSGQPTPEEQAVDDFLAQIQRETQESKQKTQQQQERDQNYQQIRDGMWKRMQAVGIDPMSQEASERVGNLWIAGDIEGARIEAATMIAEKRLLATMNPKAQKAQQSKQEGGTVVDKSGPTVVPGASTQKAKEIVNNYGLGKVSRSEYEAACKTLGKKP